MAECTSLFIFWEHVVPPKYKNGLFVRINLLIAGILWIPFRLICFPWLVYMGITYDRPMAGPLRSGVSKVCIYVSLFMLTLMSILNFYWGYLLVLKIIRKFKQANAKLEGEKASTEIENSQVNPSPKDSTDMNEIQMKNVAVSDCPTIVVQY